MSTSIRFVPKSSAHYGAVSYEESTEGSFWFIVKGVALTLLTVGIYRFWFTTAVRKNLWARAFIDGSAAEYTGKGHELLLGFLTALAVLLPAYIAVYIISMYCPDPKLGFLIAYLLLFLLVQFARYRARRYIVSRTLWRGIRFTQDGSALVYTALAAGWWLVTLLTFGLSYPFMRASLERYRIRHTLLGDTRFASDAKASSTIFNWLVVYALSILPLIGCAGVLLAANNFKLPTQVLVGNNIQEMIVLLLMHYSGLLSQATIKAISITFAGAVMLHFILRPYYRAREAKTFLAAVKVSGARLASRLSAVDIYINYFGFYFLSFIVIVLLAAPIFVAPSVLPNLDSEFPLAELATGYILIAYAVGILAISWFYFRFLQVGRLAIVAETLSIIGADALAAVTASTRKTNGSLAEGVADAVDPGGIEIGF